ncbi:MAG: futalosine hydrolase [Bacteroidales bacterium]|nr:futalosine hydrolase [Bacteroidales bacterium]
MKILITSATSMEIKLLADELNPVYERQNFWESGNINGHDIDILVTGIGTVFTTYSLTQLLSRFRYDMIINAGIAGSLNNNLKIGEVVNVVSEEFADLGVEHKEEFLTLFESGFINPDEFPFCNGLLKATYNSKVFDSLLKVRGITSNISHGNESSILNIRRKYKADIASMEGAAVFYVGINSGIPCCEIRSVSNYVEPHDRTSWNIPLSIENLKEKLLEFFKNLS